jgi:hypothetical protein
MIIDLSVAAYAVLFFWFITLERKARTEHRHHTRRLTYALTALFCIATLTCGLDFGQGYLLQVPASFMLIDQFMEHASRYPTPTPLLSLLGEWLSLQPLLSGS